MPDKDIYDKGLDNGIDFDIDDPINDDVFATDVNEKEKDKILKDSIPIDPIHIKNIPKDEHEKFVAELENSNFSAYIEYMLLHRNYYEAYNMNETFAASHKESFSRSERILKHRAVDHGQFKLPESKDVLSDSEKVRELKIKALSDKREIEESENFSRSLFENDKKIGNLIDLHPEFSYVWEVIQHLYPHQGIENIFSIIGNYDMTKLNPSVWEKLTLKQGTNQKELSIFIRVLKLMLVSYIKNSMEFKDPDHYEETVNTVRMSFSLLEDILNVTR